MIRFLTFLTGFLFLLCSMQAIAMPPRPGGFFHAVNGQVSPNLAWWAAAPFTDPAGALWLGVDGAGPDDIAAVAFHIHGLETQIVTARSYHPDRNVVAFWLAIPPAWVDGLKITASAAVLFDSNVAPLQSDRVTVSRNERGWETLQFESGWTSLIPSEDSRLIYVAADGNDFLAGRVHDRGYYLPGDPEIGPDPTNPSGPIAPYATAAAAAQAIRLTNWIGRHQGQDLYGDHHSYALRRDTLGHDWNGHPDWLLYRRGDDFRHQLQPDCETNRPRHHGLRQRGRGPNEPMVITAWGDPAGQRPLVHVWRIPGHAKHLRLVSLDVAGQIFLDPGAQSQANNAWWAEDILLEDIRARGLGASNVGAWDGVLVRRSVVMDRWDPDQHSQGLYIANLADAGRPVEQGPPVRFWPEDRWTIEETVFDRNGFKQDPNAPMTWTRAVNRDDDLPVGVGVQPRREFFDRNIYAATYGQLHLRANLFSRNGGGGSVQMRLGGIAEENVFLWNESALNTSHPQSDRERLQDSVVRANLVLHDDHFLPPGGFGQGLRIGTGPAQVGVMTDNIVAHFHRVNNGGAMLQAGGVEVCGDVLPPQQALRVSMLRNLGLSGSVTNLLVEGPQQPSGIAAGCLSGNILINFRQGEIVRYSDEAASPMISFGGCGPGGNHYLAGGTSRFAWGNRNRGSFQAWKQRGFDGQSASYSSMESLAAALGWHGAEPGDDREKAWTRDIVSYMRWIEPDFVADEGVFVDVDATGPKQPMRQRVWEVLAAFDGFPHDGGIRPRMSEADAKLAARRYHAFTAFIQQARENRKGSWDDRYTAGALNRYIREGFNRPMPGVDASRPILPAPYLLPEP